MANYSKGDVILIRYPYSDQVAYKVRPAVIVSNQAGRHQTFFAVPITSRIGDLETDEFMLDWEFAKLNVPSSIKRGIVLIQTNMVLKRIGEISSDDFAAVRECIAHWLEL
ncbi:type II toxin-antitoxin system PemK/MazF family toxin [Spirochaeta africana]|uniref:PemK-like protein n=1 Tax=Spirochaeta africana (strain ATCC 700263 / DSM 8902 / Z-7692) TaxID=889378 RepID=H9UHF5_SPIAZ|nr:type II toxin-antitoxin system PemK/MazF family toxin [Spirochaeta africana]AFG36948.1 PemK-like protein [Spirochaeta africana DSM 8902]